MDIVAARRDLLTATIADIQGSVHANDSKCSAALVVHGLLFAGLVTVVSQLGDTWSAADSSVRTIAVVLIGAAVLAFVGSIGSLLLALLPYNPRDAFIRPILAAHGPAGVFFPDLGALEEEAADCMTPYLVALRGVTTPAALELQLAYEVLKVQDIRRHEARFATFGFRLLFVEILCATGFLALIGIELGL